MVRVRVTVMVTVMVNNTFTQQSKHYDNTRIADYKKCPRSYFIRHTLGWTTVGSSKAPALVFGSSWHAGMDAIWAGASQQMKASSTLDTDSLVDSALQAFELQWTDDGFEYNLSMEELDALAPRTPGIAHEMFHNYVIHHERLLANAKVISIEQPLAVPFPELTDTWYVGRLDKVIEQNGQVTILEHKTTTAYAISGQFQRDYCDSWYAAPQIKGYQFAGTLYYPKLQSVWVDAALVHKKVHDAFKFIPVSHSWPLLQEWVYDTKEWIIRIQRDESTYENHRELTQGNFPRNEDSCFGKYGTCPFLDICRSVSDPSKLTEVPAGYVQERWEPFDTLGLDRLITTDTTGE